jgi:hypothetical protein
MIRRDWNAQVFAPESLGDDTQVELWYLADYFLLAWHDWHTMRRRYRGYFGVDENTEPFPETWNRLDERCLDLANRLIRDKQLEGPVFKYWSTSGVIPADEGDRASLREVYHVVVQNHRRWHLIRNAVEGRLESHGDVLEERSYPEAIWPHSLALVRRLNEETLLACKRLNESLGSALRYHLRCYMHSNLLVSWLDEDFETEEAGEYSRSSLQRASQAFAGESSLNQFLSEKIVIPSIEHFLSQWQYSDAHGTAKRVLERLSQAIAEIGFDDFVEDVASGDFRGGQQSLVGVSEINLIPSQTRGPCQLLLLAVSKGDKKAIGFPSVMRQVREHLIRCPVTKAVVILCDYWGPSMLDEHLGDLRAHHERGVRFLFLMAGMPSRSISPVAVDLGLTP